jgi:transketolase
VDGFGASAPAEVLYEQYGVTVDAVCDAVLDHYRTARAG